MKNLFTALGAIIFGIIVIAIAAVFGGTLVWLIWPHAIPAVFPGLVAGGMIAAKLTWWKAVLFTWLCGILIKSTTSSSSN